MPRLSVDSRIARDADQVLDRVVDGEALLIHISSGLYYSLNEVGTRIWQCLDSVQMIADLAAVIASEYDVSPEQAQSDVLNLAQELADEGLIAVV